MIIINNEKTIGSKSFTEDVFFNVQKIIANDINQDWLVENTEEITFFGDLDLTDLSINDFNMLFTAISGLDVIDRKWQAILLETMQTDPRFVQHKKVA